MKLNIALLALSLVVILFVPGLLQPVAAQPPRRDLPNIKAMSEREVVTRVSAGDPVQATGTPRADLVIKDMCFDKGAPNGLNIVNVLVANIGTVDAGPFELGIEYISAGGESIFAHDKIKGLKAGEEHWEMEFHTCCGMVPSMFLVDWASRYQAIADPKYFKAGALPTQGTEFKSVIPETNEGNNEMASNKADLRSCTTLKKIETPVMPKVRPIRPPTN